MEISEGHIVADWEGTSMDYGWVEELARTVWGGVSTAEELIEVIGGLLPEWGVRELMRGDQERRIGGLVLRGMSE